MNSPNESMRCHSTPLRQNKMFSERKQLQRRPSPEYQHGPGIYAPGAPVRQAVRPFSAFYHSHHLNTLKTLLFKRYLQSTTQVTFAEDVATEWSIGRHIQDKTG
ncbi:MAG: hypothetical protein CSA33_08230 [Desulfobulbus propionicus]|nr:MAG: hypothetical protein CSA33_08230 [Desulfobulbus propionicus]